jgi:hypothetical protein
MPQFQKLSKEDREIGKALAERAKLDPSITLEDFTVQSYGDVVTLRFEAFHVMPRAEFEALVASIRSANP